MQIAATLIALLSVMSIFVGVARKVGIPYPIFLVMVGLALSFVPGLPKIELAPDLVFLFFLPPILTATAFFTPIRDFKFNLRPILMLSFGLVLFTTFSVGWVLHLVAPGLPLAVCFTVGAIVAPPDAIAATSIAERLGLPHRMVTVLEGESLLNDAVALICYRFASAAALTGVFSWSGAMGSFTLSTVGGIGVGIVLGYAISWVSVKMQDSTMLILFTFLNTFAAYLIAESLHVSGVLACVVTGLIYGQKSACVMTPKSRLEGEAIWSMVIFIINGLAFSLIGLQLPYVVAGLEQTPRELIIEASAVVAAVVLARLVWMWPGVWLPRLLIPKINERDPGPPHSFTFVLAWAGMRGIVSLAAALALPANFPERSLVLFLTFVVVVVTLVGQGLSLYVIVPRLGLANDDYHEKEEAHARVVAAEASLARLDELEREDWTHDEHIEHYRRHYERHQTRNSHRAAGEPSEEVESRLEAMHRLRAELIDAERSALIKLRNNGTINDSVLRAIQRDLDLEALHRES